MFASASGAVLVALALLAGAAIVSLRVILAPPVASSQLAVVRGTPGTGTGRAAGEAVAGALAGWPLDYARTAAVLDTASCINRHAVASAWLSEGMPLLLAEVLPPVADRHAAAPARREARSRPGAAT